MSDSSEVKWLTLMWGRSCQVGVCFKLVKVGKHVEAAVARMVNRYKG